jgi:hypothetical protein
MLKGPSLFRFQLFCFIFQHEKFLESETGHCLPILMLRNNLLLHQSLLFFQHGMDYQYLFNQMPSFMEQYEICMPMLYLSLNEDSLFETDINIWP